MKTKMLGILLAVAMLFTLGTPAYAAKFADTAGTKYEAATDLLATLGLVEGDGENYLPLDSLTRAEMTTIAVRLYGMTDDALEATYGENETATFSDVVNGEHWAYPAIEFASAAGMVSGYPNGTFQPDNKVLFNEGVKMIVALLGYTPKANELGGYPAGYITIATQIGLLKGIDTVSGTSELCRGDMAILVKNALTAPLYEAESYSASADNLVDYTSDNNHTVLSQYLHIERIEKAIVAETYMANMAEGMSSLDKDQVKIGGETYRVGDTNASDLFARKVNFYAVEDEVTGDKEIIWITPVYEDVVTIDTQDIVMTKTTVNNICYDDGAEEINENVTGATVIYNGERITPVAADFKPIEGTITLISNNGSSYDVVIVNEYKDLVVDTKDALENRLYFKEGAPVGFENYELDTKKNSVRLVFADKDGKDITVADCIEWDIISLSVSRSGRRVIAIKSGETITGKITEKDRNTYTINEKEYKLSETNRELLEELMIVGESAAYYIDAYGKIAAVDTSYDRTYIYGWLVAAKQYKGLSPYPQFKIFNESGKMVLYDVTDRVELNGTKIKAQDLLATTSPIYNAEADVATPQLIRYKVVAVEGQDADGNKTSTDFITEIETVNDIRTDFYMAEIHNGSDRQDYEVDYDAFNLAVSIAEYNEGGTYSSSGEDEKEYLRDSNGMVIKTFSKTFWKLLRDNPTLVGKRVDPAVHPDYYNAVRGDGDLYDSVTRPQFQFYGGDLSSFGRNIKVLKTTPVFYIPSTGIDADYQVYRNYLTHWSNHATTKYTNVMNLYDVNEENIVGAVVWDKSNSAEEANHYLTYQAKSGMIVKNIVGLNADGDEVTKLRVFDAAAKTEMDYTISEDAKVYFGVAQTDRTIDPACATEIPGVYRTPVIRVTDPATQFDTVDFGVLEVGDYIQFELNEKETDIEKIVVLFRTNYATEDVLYEVLMEPTNADATKQKKESDFTSKYNGGLVNTFGRVLSIGDDVCLVETYQYDVESDGKGETRLKTGLVYTTNILIYNKDKQTYVKGAKTDIREGDYVYSYWTSTTQKSFIVVR